MFVEHHEGSFGITLRFGIGAAEMRGADDIMERFGDARIVRIGFGEIEDLRSEPVGSGVELSGSGPLFFGSVFFGVG